jgi:ABC-type lipoprotein export system ATPase subunit
VLEMFERLNVDEGITIILVTHDANVAGHARRIIRMRDGVIEAGDAAAKGPFAHTPPLPVAAALQAGGAR